MTQFVHDHINFKPNFPSNQVIDVGHYVRLKALHFIDVVMIYALFPMSLLCKLTGPCSSRIESETSTTSIRKIQTDSGMHRSRPIWL